MDRLFITQYNNYDISNWNVENVTSMVGMFNYAVGFNQNIGGWNVGKVSDCSSFIDANMFPDSFIPHFSNCNHNPN